MAFAALLSCLVFQSALEPLKPLVGQAAPPLQVEKWLAGSAVDQLEKGKVYVIDIWAPWCGPCIGGFPGLSKLQSRFEKQGLVVIGLTGKDDYGSTLEAAEKVIREKSGQIKYTMAWDKEGRTYKEWMAIESTSGWPWCFVVGKDGRIAYIGHPSRLEEVVPEIIEGKYDMAAAEAKYLARAKAIAASKQFYALASEKKYEEALKQYDEIHRLDKSVALDYAQAKLQILFVRLSRIDEALTFATSLKDSVVDSPGVVYRIVEYLLDPSRPVAERRLPVAEELAKAYQQQFKDDPGSYALLARVCAAKGDYAGAVKQQQTAVDKAPEGAKAEFQKALDEYKKKLGSLTI